MAILLEQYWWLFLVALLIGIIVAWWIFAANATARIPTTRAPDALDKDAPPARRNQALIDAPPAAAAAPAALGEAVASPPRPAPAVPAEEAPAPPQPAAPSPAATAPASTAPANTAPAQADDFTRIKGVGPKLNTLLHSLGVTSFAQIAGWDEADIDRIDAQLGNFQGRVRRDKWVEQAAYLAKGDTAGFESRFGKL